MPKDKTSNESTSPKSDEGNRKEARKTKSSSRKEKKERTHKKKTVLTSSNAMIPSKTADNEKDEDGHPVKRSKRSYSSPSTEYSECSSVLLEKLNITGMSLQEPAQPSLSSSDTPNVVWRKNPEAEMIRMMLMKQMEGGNAERTTIQVERKPEPQPSPRTISMGPMPVVTRKSSISGSPEEETRKRDRASLKKPTNSILNNFIPRRPPKKEFTIERTNEAGGLQMLENLENEFSKFSNEPTNAGDNEEFGTEKLDRRTQVALEIRASERSYVKTLTVIVQNYMSPLISAVEKESLSVPLSSVQLIFSNIAQIHKVNSQFLASLDERVSAWQVEQTLGDLFIEVAPLLKIYDHYGNTFDVSLETLKEVTKQTAFAQLLQKCDETSELNLKLESLLIAPIQRIPRYILLLNDLLRSTAAEHKDYELLKQAIPEMQKVADHINKNVQQAKYYKKFLEISNKAKSLIHSNRIMLYEGVARCESKKKNIAIYIFNDLLIQLSETKAKNKSNLALPEAQWLLHLIWIKQNKDFVELIGPSDHYRFRLTEEVEQWITLLRQVISDYLENINDESLVFEVNSPIRNGSFEFANGATYTGEWFEGKIEGEGCWKGLGSTYTGTFIDGTRHGHGVLRCSTGEVYTGNWRDGRASGEGKLEYPSGTSYTGAFDNGLKHGQGTIVYSNGDTYEGSWENDVPSGIGSVNFTQSTSRNKFLNSTLYSGNWEYGRYHNYGVLTNKNGQKYEGMWCNGIRDGQGRMIWNENCIYEGSWKYGLRDGHGVYYNSLEGKYDGEWVADVKEGKGTMEFLSGNVYTGNWKRGVFHNTGRYIYRCGPIKLYEGEWQNGRKHGKGILYYVNGDTYEGFFKDDLMHGQGEFTYSNGMVISGKWHKGTLEGKCVVTLPGGEKEGTKKSISVNANHNQLVSTEMDLPPLEILSVPDIQFDCW